MFNEPRVVKLAAIQARRTATMQKSTWSKLLRKNYLEWRGAANILFRMPSPTHKLAHTSSQSSGGQKNSKLNRMVSNATLLPCDHKAR